VPTVEGLQFAYALHPLPPGGFGFRRWRWELWHGATLLAAGWRASRSDSERALRSYAAKAAHAVFGLRPPERLLPDTADAIPLGATVHVESGAVRCMLVPRHLEAPRARLAGSH
jgi:hypothetical protein